MRKKSEARIQEIEAKLIYSEKRKINRPYVIPAEAGIQVWILKSKDRPTLQFALKKVGVGMTKNKLIKRNR